ncbi:hypothetical protein LCGC14_1558450 [marine sediment metagenome]|uniref:CheW-like domain-containing protein n=1 Tax=marine sediment metagenome TaxID=412755 RepID=A0A0F9IN76_9ZZZZ
MRQYIGFKLSSNEFTIPILKVREIINTPDITPLPQSPHYMKGIVNIRGKIIPVVDLKELIDTKGEAPEVKSGGKVIVIINRNTTFGILVDSITSVINIDEADIEPPEGFMSDSAMDRVEGVAKFDDRLIILLDTDKLVGQEEMEMMDSDIVGLNGGPGKDMEQIETAPPPQAQATPQAATATPVPQTPAPQAQPAVAKAAQPARPAKIDTVKQIHEAKDVLSRKFSGDESKNAFLIKLVRLIETMAAKDFATADTMISEMIRIQEVTGQEGSVGDLYNRIGQVTRKLHNSLKDFKNALDPRIRQIANEDVPQAVDRLEYVISKSEEAAHRTMGVVEKYQLNLPELVAHVGNVSAPDDSKQYLRAFSDSLKNDLNEIMLAQEFQDITGQTIHRVIDLVNTIEAELIGLITTFGEREGATTAETAKAKQAAEKITQNEVEDLLKEFGF